MPDIELERLRALRARADILLNTLVSDLKPFRHEIEINGFRRKPDSPSDTNDVNITTSCSCLMALALSDKLRELYGDASKNTAAAVFKSIIDAPWMSSGLAQDNAFTTALIIRLFGFLVSAKVLPATSADAPLTKVWEPHIQFADFSSFLSRLSDKSELFPQFLYKLLSQNSQLEIANYKPGSPDEEKLKRIISLELNRLIGTSSFYESGRFNGVKLSEESKSLLEGKLDAYKTAKVNRLLLHEYFSKELKSPQNCSLKAIALLMSINPENFGINNYPPTATVIYWFVDGLDQAEIHIDDAAWGALCAWSSEHFGRQRSLAVARHAAMMDPVAMAMTACLCARLRKISNARRLGMRKNHHEILPSVVELEKSVVDLFDEQTPSGIWPKYFPLFHYQDAGSNFCFTFELLEAILAEFGAVQTQLFSLGKFVCGLENAVTWCEENRLSCSAITPQNDKATHYNGWNSGGNLDTLRRGQPESWATAVVHMFLWELGEVLSRRIQHRLLKQYGATTPNLEGKKLDDLLDIDLYLDKKSESLKTTLKNSIVATFTDYRCENAELLRKRPVKKKPLSALLFGPPGTSKTEIAKAIATELGWPLLELDPSHFLQDSFQNIYTQAEKIFADIMDMAGVVVLFDEMDALVQKRDSGATLDTESKFLTTYMLPKLAKLHDRGRIVFLMATNFPADFDDAIKRAGRFDFLLCMGPPTLTDKCSSLHVFYGLDKATDSTKAAGKLIEQFAANNVWLQNQLTLYTYGEFLTLITGIADAKEINQKLSELQEKGFLKHVREDSESVGLKLQDLERLKSVGQLSKWSSISELDAIEFLASELTAKSIDIKVPVIKYILDRKQTRRQCAKSTGIPNVQKDSHQSATEVPPAKQN